MKRRHFLGASLALSGISDVHFSPAKGAPVSRVRPGMPEWPTDTDWPWRVDRTTGQRCGAFLA